MATEQEHFNAARQYQEYYDATLRKVGTHAPAPRLGQSCNDYRRETLRQLKRTFLPQTHPLYEVQYRTLKADALGALEPQVLAACETEAVNPAHVPPGEFRMITPIDQDTGLRSNVFIGKECFVKQMGRPGRRVVSFHTDRGLYDAAAARYVK
jgi:hypothetical protein